MRTASSPPRPPPREAATANEVCARDDHRWHHGDGDDDRNGGGGGGDHWDEWDKPLHACDEDEADRDVPLTVAQLYDDDTSEQAGHDDDDDDDDHDDRDDDVMQPFDGATGVGEFYAAGAAMDMSGDDNDDDNDNDNEDDAYIVASTDTEERCCPVCGANLRDVSDTSAARIAHVNACLDDAENPRVSAGPVNWEAEATAAAFRDAAAGDIAASMHANGLGTLAERWASLGVDFAALGPTEEAELLAATEAISGNGNGDGHIPPRRAVVMAPVFCRGVRGQAANEAPVFARARGRVVVDSTGTGTGPTVARVGVDACPTGHPEVDRVGRNQTAKRKRAAERTTPMAAATTTAASRVHLPPHLPPPPHHRRVLAPPSQSSRLPFAPPPWRQPPGTRFVVDGFGAEYRTTPCEHWFLTHFHADHYMGLSKSFTRGFIWCTHTTAELVRPRYTSNPSLRAVCCVGC